MVVFSRKLTDARVLVGITFLVMSGGIPKRQGTENQITGRGLETARHGLPAVVTWHALRHLQHPAPIDSTYLGEA